MVQYQFQHGNAGWRVTHGCRLLNSGLKLELIQNGIKTETCIAPKPT
jgi:hypothetical protein